MAARKHNKVAGVPWGGARELLELLSAGDAYLTLARSAPRLSSVRRLYRRRLHGGL